MSLACGLQNSMCTTFSGAVIRTTHVTGILTDIGLILGQATFYPRTRKHLWKLKVLVPLYLSFGVGGILGYLLYKILAVKAILVPLILVGVLGLAHLCYCKIILPYKIKQMNTKKSQKGQKKIVSCRPNSNHDDKQLSAPLANDPLSLQGVTVDNGKSDTKVL